MVEQTQPPQERSPSDNSSLSGASASDDSGDDSRIIRNAQGSSSMTTSQRRWTPLHSVVSTSQNISMVESLLKTGADPNETDRDGKKPIYYTCHDCHTSPLTELLIRHGSGMCQHMDWDAKEKVLIMAFQRLSVEHDQDTLLRLVVDCMEDINKRSIERNAVVTAMLFLYTKTIIILCYIFNIVLGVNIACNVLLYIFVAFTLLTEALECHHLVGEGAELVYIQDTWKWIHLTSYVFVVVSTSMMIRAQTSEVEEWVIITTIAFLSMSLLGDLKITFLPFSIFVSGVTKIFYELIPFLTLTLEVILAFSLMYYVQGPEAYSEPGSKPSFEAAFFYVFAGFAGGLDDVNSYLDVTFGLVLVIVLFNVVIAIVTTSWQTAVNESFLTFCKHRVELIRMARVDEKIEEKYPCLKGISCVEWLDQEFWIDRFDDRWTEWGGTCEERLKVQSSKALYKLAFHTVKALCLVGWGLLGAISLGILWPTRIRRFLFGIYREKDTVSMSVSHVVNETKMIDRNVSKMHAKVDQQDARIKRLETKMDGISAKLDLILEHLVPSPTSTVAPGGDENEPGNKVENNS